jgi:membrane fusion protein (multidrug efflux system)
MLMTLDLYANQRQALVVSESALVPLGSNNFVFVVTDVENKTRVEKKAVTIGERLYGAIEIIDGLRANDRVITHGLQKIRAGQDVIIALTEPPLSLSSKKANPESKAESKGQAL